MQYNTHQGILKQLKRKQSLRAWNKPFSLHKSCQRQTRTCICYIHPSAPLQGRTTVPVTTTHLIPYVSHSKQKHQKGKHGKSLRRVHTVSRQRRNIVNISVISTLVLKLQMRVNETDARNLKHSHFPAMSPGNTALDVQRGVGNRGRVGVGEGYQNWIRPCPVNAWKKRKGEKHPTEAIGPGWKWRRAGSRSLSNRWSWINSMLLRKTWIIHERFSIYTAVVANMETHVCTESCWIKYIQGREENKMNPPRRKGSGRSSNIFQQT